MTYKQPSSGPFKLIGSSPAKKSGGFKISKLPKKTLLTTIGSFAVKRALGAADMLFGNESLGKGSTRTARQLGPKDDVTKKPDFKAINKSLRKSMYKPLPK